MLYDNLDDAVHAFVSEMNALPQEMIQKLMAVEPNSWTEVTAPTVGDRVYLFDKECEGEIVDTDEDGDYIIKVDSEGYTICRDSPHFEVERDACLPMWGTMWSFHDSLDDWWLEEDDGIQKMSDCGFRVYYNEDWGYFFGIDGAGYDFFEAHWTPLYKARGLHWVRGDNNAV